MEPPIPVHRVAALGGPRSDADAGLGHMMDPDLTEMFLLDVLPDLLRRSAAASCFVAGSLAARAELLPGLTVLAETRFSGGTLPPDWRVNGPPWRIDDGAHISGRGGY